MDLVYALTYFDNHMSGESEYLIGVFNNEKSMVEYLESKGYKYFEESDWGTTICVESEKEYNELIKSSYLESRFEYKTMKVNQVYDDHMVGCD